MKVLIVKVSALGDVVHALPVLAYLHAASPGVQVDWLVEESFAPLLHGHPLLRRVISLRTKQWRKLGLGNMLTQVYHFCRHLRQERYDVVLDLQGNSKSGFFTLVSRGGDKYGFDRHQVREWPNLLATNHRVAVAEHEHHIAARCLAVARGAMGREIDVALAGPLPVDETARRRVRRQLERLQLRRRALVVLNYGTTWTTKLWHLDNWCALARRLEQRGDCHLLLTWGNVAEHQAAQMITAAAPTAHIWPRCSLPQLVALLDAAAVVVGCDTGPIHIAAAVATPTVSLYRVTDAERNGPAGEPHCRLQAPLECSPCLRKQCDDDERCARSIGVDEVYRNVCALLDGKAAQ